MHIPLFRTILASAIGLCVSLSNVSAMTRSEAETVLDQLLARYPIELLETPIFDEKTAPDIRITLPKLRQEIGGLPQADHMMITDAELLISDDADGLTRVQISLPEKLSLLSREGKLAYQITLGSHSAQMKWNRKTAEVAGLDAEISSLQLRGKVKNAGRVQAEDVALSWSDERIHLSTGKTATLRFGGLRGIQLASSEILLFEQPRLPKQLQLTFSAQGMRTGFPFSPRNISLDSLIVGTDWKDANQILSDGMDLLLSGELPRQVAHDIGSRLLQQFSQDEVTIRIQMANLEGSGMSAAASGHVDIDKSAYHQATSQLTVAMTGHQQLVGLVGTPNQPTLLGALVPDLVRALDAAKIQDGTAFYDVVLEKNGTISANGRVLNPTKKR